jgi:hypothetical protein
MTGFRLKGRIPVRSGLLASLALLFVPPMPGHAGEPAPATHGAAPASATRSVPQAAWPDNGIAQRQFPDAYSMFVENDRGHWHAWVLSGGGLDRHTKALEFFSGNIVAATVEIDPETREQEPSFAGHGGIVHWANAEGFRFRESGVNGKKTGLPDGLVDDGLTPSAIKGFMSAGYVDPLQLDATECAENFSGIVGGATTHKPSTWDRVPLYRTIAAGQPNCPAGSFSSRINTTLDLGDGTFLATMGCWVFRLRASDLSPTGAAPALRVVDAAAMRRAIAAARGKHLKDAAEYLRTALHLDIEDANSCRIGKR